MCVIRDFPDVQIEYIRKLNALDIRPTMQEFIEGLYACDTVPIEHLRGKTRYLELMPPEFMFVLLKNLRPEEQTFGEGEFAHIQCARIKELKEAIRDRWNPYDGDKRTEEHVVHGSDYPAQVEYILEYLGLPPLSVFETPREHGLRYFVELGKYDIRKIELDKITCRTAFGETSIKDGIWYRYLQGDRQPYIDYMEQVIGVNDFDDHYPEQFDKLADGFQYRDLIPVTETADGYRMKDGNHRAAILYSWGEREVMAIVERRMYDATEFARPLSNCVVIRRKPYFPKYYAGEDIDLVAACPYKVVRKLEKKFPDCVVSERENGYHVDLLQGDVLQVRFDIVSSLINGDERYLSEMRERAAKQDGFRFPHPTDEIILRSLEYATHPEKDWHFRFITEGGRP